MKLHLGCGYGRLEGWTNCDLYAHPSVDVAFDVQKDWPFEDNSAEAIYSSHMLEHLTDPLAFFREAHRVLQPSASMMLRCPYGGNNLAWIDLTHVRPWFARSFACLQPGYGDSIRNPQHATWKWPFDVRSVDLRIHPRFVPWLKWRWLQRRVLDYGEHIANFAEEMWIHLVPVKSEDEATVFRQMREPNGVPTRWCMYTHDWEKRDLRDGEKPQLTYFGG